MQGGGWARSQDADEVSVKIEAINNTRERGGGRLERYKRRVRRKPSWKSTVSGKTKLKKEKRGKRRKKASNGCE